MLKTAFLLAFVFFNNLLFSQKNSYPYEYEIIIPETPSFCYFELENKNNIDTSDILTIQIFEEENGIYPTIAPILLVFSNKDSIRPEINIDGIITIENKSNLESFKIL